MKKLYLYLFVLLLFAFSCGKNGDSPDNKLEVTFENPDETISYLGGEYFLKVSTIGTWQISSSAIWLQVNKTSEATAVVTITRNNTENARSATIEVKSGSNSKTITITQQKFDETLIYYPSKEAYRIEVPRLSDDIVEKKTKFVVNHVNYKGNEVLNYCLEYDYTKHHSRWVAFIFDNTTIQRNTSRPPEDPFMPDPKLLNYTQNSSDYSGSGYTRGHLVASADRLFSREANDQTFYYSNISPQSYNFNVGIWAEIEKAVRKFTESNTLSDTIFVVKGGTIADNQTLGTIGANKIAIPKYYYMAILAKKHEVYKSIGFYLEHKKYYAPHNLTKYTVSIDELEEKTSINFFHNLPDAIENEVEKQHNNNDWPGL